MTRHEPPRWLWLWLPLAVFPVLLLGSLRDDTDPTNSRRFLAPYLMPWDEQHGVVELATPVFSALAIIAGICVLRHRAHLPDRWLRGWVVLVTLGCVYFTGEELAWSQNQLGFNSPEWWPASVTNVHSLGEDALKYWWAPYLFEEAPRLLLELFVLSGGIIRVLVQRGDMKRGDWRDWFWPTYICLPSALLAILARTPDRLDYNLGLGYHTLLFDPATPWQSFQEMYLALFLLCYLSAIWYRVTDGTGRASTDTSGSRTRRTVTVGRQLHRKRK